VSDPAVDAQQQLYAVRPSAFVEARKAAAAALRQAGRTAEARAVLRLRKPSPTLWATNQLARIEPKRLAAFLESVGRARDAQLRDPPGAAAALREQRRQLEALVDRAGALLDAEGRPATLDARQRISNTLLGAAVDRSFANDLRQGRLGTELAAPGFEVLSGAAPGARLQVVRGPRAPAADAGKREEQRRARDEERLRQRREAEELARAATARQEAVDTLIHEVEDLARRLAAARGRLRDARRAARTASAAARRARDPRP
jgi:hypothetical protein